MVSDAADNVCNATGLVVEVLVVHEFAHADRATGEVDEAKGVTGAGSVPPGSRTARANPSAAVTRANASDALRMLRPERRGSVER